MIVVMSRSYSFAPGEYYHIYNRGVEKRAIFIDKFDYERFIQILFLCNSSSPTRISRSGRGLSSTRKLDRRGEELVYIGAYCLMPNHFHLLVKEKDGGNMAKFMKKLLTAYAMYFNVKNERKGRLFETSYLATHASYDQYLKYLFAYIHLNPLKLVEPKWREEGIQDLGNVIKYLHNYEYSSFRDYAGDKREAGLILKPSEFPDYYTNSANFIESIFEWIKVEQ